MGGPMGGPPMGMGGPMGGPPRGGDQKFNQNIPKFKLLLGTPSPPPSRAWSCLPLLTLLFLSFLCACSW
jgi:hypothetical protein